jgi:hypothetical protein
MENLKKILKPPETTNGVPSDELWIRSERLIGKSFPNDYKAFVNLYGSCLIGEFFYPWIPFAKLSYINLLYNLDKFNNFEETRKLPYQYHPTQDGLLPCGSTIDGATLFWVTKGETDSWQLFALNARSPEYEEFPFGFVEFLTRLIQGNLQSKLINPSQLNKQSLFDNDFSNE